MRVAFVCVAALCACGSLANSAADAEENAMLQLGSNSAVMRQYPLGKHGPVVHRPCASLDAEGLAPEEAIERQSLRELCAKDPELWEAALAPGYEANYQKLYDRKGWVDEAFVTYFSVNPGVKSDFPEITRTLIESVHNFTSRPLIVANVGTEPLPASCSAEKYPRLVVFNLKPFPSDKIYHMNKLRAMILAQVRTGVQVDSDTVVLKSCDRLFRRTREEINEEYPYPMMPVHWMSRDDDPAYFDETPYNVYAFKCPGCPTRTMRWAQAHPTWTFHALPFVGKLLTGHFDEPMHVMSLLQEAIPMVGQDEDKFNVGLWAFNATKQWCKYENPPVRDLMALSQQKLQDLVSSGRKNQNFPSYSDPKWFPAGVPVTFDMWHGEKNVWKFGTLLSDMATDPHNHTMPWGYFNGTYYETEEAMEKAMGKRAGGGAAGIGCYL